MLIKQLDFLGYPKYAVRDDGVVINIERVSIIKPDVNKSGYHRVLLYKNSNECSKESVHRLVAAAFIDNPEAKPCVNHKDNRPGNNVASNLEWCTHKENTQHMLVQNRYHGSPNKKLTSEDIALITGSDLGSTTLSRMLGCSKQAALYWKNKAMFIKETE